MISADPPRFTLDELAEASNVSKRTIRYYIEQGLISPALGQKRSAYYTPHHLEELELVRQSRERGLSISEIRDARRPPAAQAPRGAHWERFILHPMLELHLHADAPPFVRRLAERLTIEAAQWLGEIDPEQD